MSLAVVILVVLAAVVFAGLIWTVIYRATGNAFDWLILTFGNEESANEVKRRRGWTD